MNPKTKSKILTLPTSVSTLFAYRIKQTTSWLKNSNNLTENKTKRKVQSNEHKINNL